MNALPVRTTLIASVVALCALTASAQTKIYRGSIGNSHIQMRLTFSGNQVSGTYAYDSVGQDLKLTGHLNNGGLELTEAPLRRVLAEPLEHPFVRPVRAGGKPVEGQDHLENDFSLAHVGRDLPARPNSSPPDRRAVAADRFEQTGEPSTDERSGDPRIRGFAALGGTAGYEEQLRARMLLRDPTCPEGAASDANSRLEIAAASSP